MGLSVSTDQVDENRREKLSYGTDEFPIAFFDDDLGRVNVPLHWHDEFEIITVVSGKQTVWIGGDELTLSRGEGYFANSGILHAADAVTEKCRQHAMVFGKGVIAADHDIWDRLYVQPVITNLRIPFIKLSPGIPWQKEILDLSEAAWHAGAYDEENFPLTVRENLSRVFSLLLKHAGEMTSEHQTSTRSQREEFRVKKALRFMESNCGEDLSIEDIARSADISVSVLLRCFRSVLHTTPIRCLRKYRMDQSAAAIASNDGRSIAEIAGQYGFIDMSYFDRCFRDEFGTTPTEFRSRAGKES